MNCNINENKQIAIISKNKHKNQDERESEQNLVRFFFVLLIKHVSEVGYGAWPSASSVRHVHHGNNFFAIEHHKK
jgi:hypothetical protein